MTMLDGTLPVRPFHPDRFFGTVQVDGQHPRITALACHHLEVVAISLVGYDTSISAALATLWQRQQLAVLLADGIEWKGPRQVQRLPIGYKQFSTHLPGTREVHAIALPLSAHLAEGILHPPDLPPPCEEPGQIPASTKVPAPIQAPEVDRSRFVLGNWDEATPHRRSFLGQLYAMRVIFLHRHHRHPEWADLWADALWQHGLTRELIHPLPALGIKAWWLSGDLDAWSGLIKDGVHSGWLPWRENHSAI